MTLNTFEVCNGEISIQGKKIQLPHEVNTTLCYLELIVVKIEPPAGVVFNRNIFALSRDGEVKWQIQESPHGTQKDKPYIDMFISKSGALIAANWNGVSYSVNPSNGDVVVNSFDK